MTFDCRMLEKSPRTFCAVQSCLELNSVNPHGFVLSAVCPGGECTVHLNEPRFCQLNFRYRACFERGVP